MRRAGIAQISAICLALFAMLASVATGSQAASGDPDRMGLSYEVYSGGFHVFNFDLDLALADDRYDVITRIQSAGLVSWFISWTQVSESAGTLQADIVSPLRHRSEGQVRGRRRSVEIDYQGGQVSAVRVVPPPHEDEGRDEVPEAQRREAMDPISAIFGTIRRISAGQPCTGRVPVFDGRRRYDLVLSDRGARILPQSRLTGFSGQAVQCDFVYEPLAGHNRSDPDPETRERRRVQSGRVYAARNGMLIVPVRVEIDGDWGMTVAHLREVRNSDAPAK